MNIEQFKELINSSREIEFDYNGSRFSITYYNDNRPNHISFCEFNKEPVDVKSADELLRVNIDNISVEEIISSLPDSNFDIF